MQRLEQVGWGWVYVVTQCQLENLLGSTWSKPLGEVWVRVRVCIEVASVAVSTLEH